MVTSARKTPSANLGTRILSGCLVLFAAGVTWAEPNPAQPSYLVEFSAHVTRTHPSDPGKSGQGMMYVSKKALRSESNVQNQLLRVIYHADVNEAWILFPDRKVYLRQPGPAMTRPPMPDEASSPCQTDKSFTCRNLGRDRIDNRETRRWEITYTNPQGTRETTQLWVDPRLQIAIKELYHDGGSVQLTAIREGEQNPDLFKIPADYQQMILPGTVSSSPSPSPSPSTRPNP
ncbi:MAG: hypothetical protein H7833_10345 [Magnetococcus sp. DMHC-1]|nr:hypothetical protein [Magnetococcales bacterium]